MGRPALKSRSEILDIAKEFFAKKGYKATTMEEIARACGMTKASLYYHFPSKRELYREVLRKIYSEMSREFASFMTDSKDYVQRGYDLVSFFIDFIADNRDLAEITMRGLMDNDPVIVEMIRKEGKILAGSVKVFIELGVQTGKLKNMPPEMMVHVALGMCFFHFISGEVGRSILGVEDIYSDEVIKEFKKVVLEILMTGILRGEGNQAGGGKDEWATF